MWSSAYAVPTTSPLPWLLPVVALALLASFAGSGPLARWLGASRGAAWTLIFSTGVILAITATPLRAEPWMADSVRSCDFSRIGPPSVSWLLWPSDVLGNILMFIPLGFAIALVPRSTRKTAVLAAAICLPFLIELNQLGVASLRRSCQSADLVDNLTGLALGLAAGTFAAWLSGKRRARVSVEP